MACSFLVADWCHCPKGELEKCEFYTEQNKCRWYKKKREEGMMESKEVIKRLDRLHDKVFRVLMEIQTLVSDISKEVREDNED